MKVRVLIALILCCLWVGAESAAAPPETVLQRYCAATRGQDQLMQASSMDIEIAASLPKLKKHGKLLALRRVSALGRITYEKLRFEGDGTVKKQIINRYLSAEAEAQDDPSLSIALTPENYKFKYKGKTQLEATFLRVQESGYLVKSPSVLLKKVAFIRTYQIRDGISVPRQEQSVVDTRLGVGRAEMTIDFRNFAIDRSKSAADGAPGIL